MRLRQNRADFPGRHTLSQKKQHRHTQAAKLANYLPTLHAHKMHVTGKNIHHTTTRANNKTRVHRGLL